MELYLTDILEVTSTQCMWRRDHVTFPQVVQATKTRDSWVLYAQFTYTFVTPKLNIPQGYSAKIEPAEILTKMHCFMPTITLDSGYEGRARIPVFPQINLELGFDVAPIVLEYQKL